MGKLDTRLKALEAQEQAVRGIRIFQQDFADVHIYYEGIDNQRSTPVTCAEIGAWGAAGWQCIVVTYEDREIEQGDRWN